MGNQESKPSEAHHARALSSQHPSHASNQHHGSGGSGHHERRGTVPRRRESVHAGSSLGTKTTASPSHAASLTSAIATTTNSSKRSAEETLKRAAQPPVSQSQSHSQPQSVASAPQLPTADTMGNASSKDSTRPVAAAAAAEKAKAQTPDPTARPSPLPRPIDVPASHASMPASMETFSAPTDIAPSFPDASYQLATPSAFSRPPRLPLPIEQEVHAPGSPILSPTERETIPTIDDVQLSRRTSVLSGTTEDDDLGDDISSLEPWGGAQTVPTLLEWREDGEKVYVTGTFAGWDKKFRLHRNGPSKHPGALSAYINLAPGTHHVRFIVDNESRLSKSMPTAVDYNNFLVNYIEVAPPPPPITEAQKQAEAQKPGSSTIPAVSTMGGSVASGVHTSQVPPTTHAPVVPPVATKPDATPRQAAQSARDTASTDTLASQIAQPKPAPIALGPAKKYHTQIPQYLLDIEAEEDQNLYRRASDLLGTLPDPPSLPMFLGKSVLNGATPMKDDASVLVMPNHTVLNHLATSSIKNKVLATSATTRYKKKFLTTIMYKPTNV